MERLLDPLRDDDPLPSSTVDIQRAVRAGRRRVRARWTGVGAAVVLVLAVVVPVLSQTAGGGDSVGPAYLPPQPGPVFDPLRRVVTVGDVPETSPYGYSTARRWQQMSLKVGTGGSANVIVYAPGWPATYATGGVIAPETGASAEPVAGRRAYWLDRTLSGQPGPMLVWEWSDDAWAFVQTESQSTDRAMLHRIATTVRVGAGEPVTMPFTVPVPAGQHLIGTSAQIRPPGDPFVRTGLRFDTEDPGDPGRYASDQRGFSVDVENGDKFGQALGADRQVDGHPARVVDGQAQIFGLTDGFGVDVQGAGSQDTLREIARTVQLLPAPGDKTTWTAQPLR